MGWVENEAGSISSIGKEKRGNGWDGIMDRLAHVLVNH